MMIGQYVPAEGQQLAGQVNNTYSWRRLKTMSNYSSWTTPTSIRRILFLVAYTFVASLLALSGATSAWASDFDIDRARYSVDRDRLTIRGDSEDDAEVRLFDDDSNVLFATVEADSDGNWSYRENDPQAIPCRVRAESEDNKSDERDVRNASRFPGGCGIDEGGGGPPPPAGEVSINSTSQNCGSADISGNGIDCSETPVPEQPFVGNNAGHTVVAINDLGMHCGDLDTRISSILPPFQVLLAQVILKGEEPELLGPSQAEVFYSAVSNPGDPILGNPSVFRGLTADGSIYKTNFWDFPVPAGTYDAFYPAFNPFTGGSLMPLASVFGITYDVGLPVPNLENFYFSGALTAALQDMPGILNPYVSNDPQQVHEHLSD
jgi:hypothetical protein